MKVLLDKLLDLPELRDLAQELERGRSPQAVSGLSPVHRAQAAAALAHRLARPLAVICTDEGEANRLAGDLETLLGQPAIRFFGRELAMGPGASVSHQWEHKRIAALYALGESRRPVVVATAEGMLQRTWDLQALREAAISLTPGERVEDLPGLPERLVAMGYRRSDQVEGPGQFAVRGGILDVYSPDMAGPVRCDFFDDEVDSLGIFDVTTQRRTENLSAALLLPASEQAEGQTMASPFAALPPDTLLCLMEASRVEQRVKDLLWQAREDTEALLRAGQTGADLTRALLTAGEWTEGLGRGLLCMMEALPTSRWPIPPRGLSAVSAKQLSAYGGSLDTAIVDMQHYLSAGFGVLLLCGNETRGKNLQRMLEERGLSISLDFAGREMPQPGEARISVGSLSAGAEYPGLKLAVLTEGQLTEAAGRRSARPRKAKESSRQKLLSYTDLTVGDLVVHAYHGIGRFAGIQRMPVDGVEKDYVKIAYAGTDVLYVPATQLDMVSKYIGGGQVNEETGQPRVKLNKLGGAEWNRQKSKSKAAAKDLAKGLIALYAQRKSQPGFAFSPDTPWQQEFEASFDYEETEDQLRCVQEIKRDMERPMPMDRLLCGDVGYGKTEVALRAVMKCVLDGKQAAILVPTTVLAQQHYATAVTRFRSFPVNIQVLSRFQTPGQSREILRRLKEGSIDLLIGTHRLLQKSIQFKDLGLLIIDEEQRFGVAHKEKLKEMSRGVDVLTLSATPIPRTLNMALSGIRDMSTLEEPPQDRQPVQTYVVEHDWGMLIDAMRRELDRGGQVFYLHNRVETIDRTAAQIRELLGEDARVVVGHGKLGERELGSVMEQMVAGEAQVLVCTTIIETGIDIPNVNTLIIEDADKMGLSQLHQIRGRIGRSARRAYAYMTYRRDKMLSEIASRRLTAIREFVEFGSGFKVAMRDLEIRGAGNLLGPEQSGYMMSVGYDMYLQLLEEAVQEEQGQTPKKAMECSADLTISANIPETYVPSAEQRMDLYQRIAAIRDNSDAGDLLDEMIDRYGEPPKSVQALLDVALLRAAALLSGVTEIVQRKEKLELTLTAVEDPAVILKICAMPSYRQRLVVSGREKMGLTLTLRPGEQVLDAALALVELLREAQGSPDQQAEP